jgi:hypothetical protein
MSSVRSGLEQHPGPPSYKGCEPMPNIVATVHHVILCDLVPWKLLRQHKKVLEGIQHLFKPFGAQRCYFKRDIMSFSRNSLRWCKVHVCQYVISCEPKLEDKNSRPNQCIVSTFYVT